MILLWLCLNSFDAVGVEADGDNIELLLSQVKNRDITELIAAGREKLASVPSGGSGAVAVAASAAGGGGSAPTVAEAKKEEKVEEKEESDDVSTHAICVYVHSRHVYFGVMCSIVLEA